ncbi:MAG TPA: FAD-dependent oxidoreductase [Deltaproteobacteria bacterium]|nr:FAD-dependent oxidoreductase [Deltaproteobacteria bacterium]
MRNRIYFAAHATLLLPLNAGVNDQGIAYYEARAKGGAAAIITGCHLIGPMSTQTPKPPSHLADERTIPDLKKCADVIHKHGARAICQLGVIGRLADTRPFGGVTWGPSSVRLDLAPMTWEIPHEMEREEIEQVVDEYRKAAKNVKAAGYDGIEIMGAGGLLNHQFLSPRLNFRNDEYGGSLENRLRLQIDCIDAVREAMGNELILGFKMPGDDFIDGGLTLDEAKEIARALEATGKVDYLTVVAGLYIIISTHVPPMYYPLGPFVYLSSEIKKAVKKINVNCMAKVNDPGQANKIIADGHADMIGMVRTLICDPEFVNKARDEREDEIRACVTCEEACYGRYRRGLHVSCSYNPQAGRELQLPIVPVTTRKKVMVIGGGVSGLETARVAALRGHQVSLYEREGELGGQVRIAAMAFGRTDFEEMPRYYTKQMKLLDVEVHLETEVTPEMVAEMKPDAVVVATGSVPLELDVPGADQKNVVEPRSVLQGKVEVGQHVVVIAGEHNMQALTTADTLAEKGKKVQVLTEAFYAGSQAPFATCQTVYTRLLRAGAIITNLTAVKEIRGNTVITRNVFTDAEGRIEGVDTVVAAMGGKAENALYCALRGKARELYAVGDCRQPRLIPQATLDGLRVGIKL